jgi:hypothetical protein
VYNKELVYQQREFAVLLNFCEMYSGRFAYDMPKPGDDSTGRVDEVDDLDGRRRSSRKRRRRQCQSADAAGRNEGVHADSTAADATGYVVSQLVDVRENNQGVKQVLVAWDGYRRRTWEPYESIKQQLPEMIEKLEQQLSTARAASSSDGDAESVTDGCRAFLQAYIHEHGIGASYRWVPDRVAALELAASLQNPPVKMMVAQLVQSAMALMRTV